MYVVHEKSNTRMNTIGKNIIQVTQKLDPHPGVNSMFPKTLHYRLITSPRQSAKCAIFQLLGFNVSNTDYPVPWVQFYRVP